MENNVRIELHNKLLEYCDTCYFQPPETVKLSYPCIIYSRNQVESLTANNINYKNDREWTIRVIAREPDSEIPTNLLQGLSMISLIDDYVSDGLYNTILKHYTHI